MTPSEQQAMNIAIAKFIGWSVQRIRKGHPMNPHGGFALCYPAGDWQGVYSSEEAAWSHVPNFFTDWNASGALLLELAKRGIRYVVGFDGGPHWADVQDQGEWIGVVHADNPMEVVATAVGQLPEVQQMLKPQPREEEKK